MWQLGHVNWFTQVKLVLALFTLDIDIKSIYLDVNKCFGKKKLKGELFISLPYVDIHRA